MKKSLKRYALVTIFIAIFADILGFGMIIPLAPILARDFGADGLQVGFLISIYSIVQFIFAPYWGRLSDYFGRKPILLIGLLGMSLAHIWFAFSTSFSHLFFSRIVAGFFGANIVIAMAYISDITHSQERSKNLGLIGMAFGFGFTFGPALGFLFILIGNKLGSAPPYGASFAALGAALVCIINFVMAYFFLKESQTSNSKISGSVKSSLFSRPSPSFIWKSLTQPKLGKIFLMSFILWISIAQIEPVLILLVQDDFGWTKSTAYWSFAYIGFLMAFSQGFLVRKLIPFYGERLVNKWGLFLVILGLFLIACSPWAHLKSILFFNLILLVSGVTFFSVGYSLTSTSLSGALSLLSPKEQQGRIFGVNQSLSSLARILGPLLGGWCYRDLSHSSPFFLASVMGFFAFSLAIWVGKDFPNLGLVSKKTKDVESLPPSYSIDRVQLKNLIDKRIPFHFFQMEKLIVEDEFSEVKNIVNQSVFKTEEEVLSFIKNQNLHCPFVFLCENGFVSEKISEDLRAKGYINAYYVEKGLRGLKKN